MTERSWTFAIDSGDGSVIMHYHDGHANFITTYTIDEFASFASMVNGALGDSKMAAS